METESTKPATGKKRCNLNLRTSFWSERHSLLRQHLLDSISPDMPESHVMVFIPAVNRGGHVRVVSLWTLMLCDGVSRGIPQVGWAFHFGSAALQSAHRPLFLWGSTGRRFHKLLFLPNYKSVSFSWTDTPQNQSHTKLWLQYVHLGLELKNVLGYYFFVYYFLINLECSAHLANDSDKSNQGINSQHKSYNVHFEFLILWWFYLMVFP